MPSDQSMMKNWKYGQLSLIDNLPNGDPRLGSALHEYANNVNINKQSRQWKRTVGWMENVLFGTGRHYVDDLLVSRLSRNADTGDLSLIRETAKSIPRPVNDFLGRYIETNIALLTENRPIPRVSPSSDQRDDKVAARLSELTTEYLWEKLGMPEKQRELVRLLLYTGVGFLETIYDELEPRYMSVPETEEVPFNLQPEGLPQVQTPLKKRVTKFDRNTGRPSVSSEVKYGDITSKVISPFEIHLPTAHWWNGDDMGWIMREYYVSMDVLKDRIGGSNYKGIVTKKNGWYVDNLSKVSSYNVHNLPLWWWERLTDLVEGPGPSLYVGTPEQWEGYTVVRIFDRKPSPKWPRGRTVIVAGDQVIYDSPKARGARAYDPRWPHRWHPYTRYRWEGQVGSIYGRSLVSKLLPKIKRINSIDTTMIMWRRTVPIATWIVPKGSSPVEDIFSGKPGKFWEYDARRTAGQAPAPIYPPEYPRSAMEERALQIKELDDIAGTQEILRGERPTGATSGVMLEALRKQAIASRSPILQAYDESLQDTAGALLQETIKHVGSDPAYLERIKILGRNKYSRFSIETFAGSDLSDNTSVEIDTQSMALMSREAKQGRAIELMQYAQGLMTLPATLRQKIVSDLGWPDTLMPQNADITRVQLVISWIKSNRLNLAWPMPEDDPYIFHEFLVDEMKSEEFIDLPDDQRAAIQHLSEYYQGEIVRIEEAAMDMQAKMGSMANQDEAEASVTAKGEGRQ